ncbi:MAG: hypothetical protein M0013_04115 [Actinomycetota bacterium]|nr:hypothetical protein [Actinomycetota bacterium]
MPCTQCGGKITPTSRSCPVCGAPVTTGTQVPAVVHRTADIHRLAPADLVVGGATVVLFIALFLPWYSVNLGIAGFGFTVNLDGLWQGWMYLTLLLCLGTIGYLVARIAATRIRLPFAHWQLLTTVTGLTALLTLLGVFVTPAGTSYSWGGFVGLIAAVTALAGSIVRKNEPEVLAAAPVLRPLRLADVSPADTQAPAAPVAGTVATGAAAHCISCGTANPEENPFCRSCGEEISATGTRQ